jgi:hypothetical protein
MDRWIHNGNCIFFIAAYGYKLNSAAPSGYSAVQFIAGTSRYCFTTLWVAFPFLVYTFTAYTPVGRLAISMLFITACAAGFNTVLPRPFPFPLEVVYLSGALETLFGIGLLFTVTRK